MKKETEKIEISMTWEYAAKVIILSLEAGNEEGKKIAREQLIKMAKIADMYVNQLTNNKN